MSKYQTLVGNKREPLHKLLPLTQPLALYIGTNDSCNFSCKFCYRSISRNLSVSDQKTNMSMDFFKKLILDLSDFEKPINTLYIGEYAEPLLHPQFPEFVKIAKDSNKAMSLKMSTNAYLLTPELSRRIISAGMDIIQISINGMSNEHYKSIVNRDIEFARIRDNVEYLYSIKEKSHIHIKCIGDYFSEEQKEEFLNVFSIFCDSIHIEDVANQWLDLKLNTKSDSNRFGLKNIKTSLICSRPFYMIAVHYDGKVVSCPVNHKRTFYVGDACKASLKNIWDSKTVYDLRMAHLLGNYKDIYNDCAMCNFTEFQSSEDLTPYREELIIKYEQRYSHGE